MNTQADFHRGLQAGMPIGAGYFSVSLSFGILAVSYGFTWWQALPAVPYFWSAGLPVFFRIS